MKEEKRQKRKYIYRRQHLIERKGKVRKREKGGKKRKTMKKRRKLRPKKNKEDKDLTSMREAESKYFAMLTSLLSLEMDAVNADDVDVVAVAAKGAGDGEKVRLMVNSRLGNTSFLIVFPFEDLW